MKHFHIALRSIRVPETGDSDGDNERIEIRVNQRNLRETKLRSQK